MISRRMVLLPRHRGWFAGLVYRRGGTKKISDNQHIVGGITLSSIWKQNFVSEKSGHNNLYQRRTIVSLEELRDGTRTSKRNNDCSRQDTTRSTNANAHALPLPCHCLASWEFHHSLDCGTFNTLIINKGGVVTAGVGQQCPLPFLLLPIPADVRCSLLPTLRNNRDLTNARWTALGRYPDHPGQ